MGIFSKILGDPNDKFLKACWVIVEKINAMEADIEKLSNDELKQKTIALKERLKNGETLDDVLPESFALVREASKRTLGQRHFDVQMIGAMALHQGKIAEMKTGEGKTLTSTLAVYLNALSGLGVHVVTVNDYLAKRDAMWMGQIYHMLGLSVGCITNEVSFLFNGRETKPCNRKEAYLADITYGTNNEFGFDYLRDNLVFELQDKAQRDFNFAIVDEIDSILIDEARTPLIISQPDFESSKLYKDFSRIIPRLKEPEDYNLDEKLKTASLTDQGVDKIEKILGVGNIYESKGIKYLHFLEQSLKAMVFFQKDKDYIVKDGQIIIIDEFTGRLLPGRRYSGGLHQAIEAKEKVEVQPESKILATITFQNYFRFYRKLAGMTGTALTSSEEFDKVYKLTVASIPTNKPMIRKDLGDKIYKNEKVKFKAIVQEAKAKNQQGQPILIGTKSVEKNEYLSRLLDREGIKHNVLNAKNHEREGEIIAQAGQRGAVTVATNMAGRGVDIMLGGTNPAEAERSEILALGGLYVIGTERHEARRIDDQLRGRAGRQGDPGVSQFYVSLEDDLMRVFGGERLKAVMDTLKVPEDEPIQAGIISKAIEKAQIRVEGFNFDARKHVLEYDDVIAKHRTSIYNRRQSLLKQSYQELKQEILSILENEITKIISQAEDIIEEAKTILPIPVNSESTADYLIDLIHKAIDNKENHEGQENSQKIFKFVCLKSIDFFWTEHLVSLDNLKDSVGLRAYGGRDPIVEYKTEAHKLFYNLQSDIDEQIAKTVFKVSIK